METQLQAGALRTWWIRNPPATPTYQTVASPEEAVTVLAALAEADLRRGSGVESNAGGLEVFDGTEWEEWASPDGFDIDEFGDALTD